jgi:hypothetical protein
MKWLCLITLLCSGCVAAEEAPKAVSPEGTWLLVNPRDILGGGIDTEVTIRKTDGGNWEIDYVHIISPRVGKGQQPVIKREGPFKAAIDKGVMTIARPDKVVRVTFKVEHGRLAMPAFISPEPGVWIFEQDHESLRVKCMTDPEKTPVGEAELPGVLKGAGFYSYEISPKDPENPTRCLRFMERLKSGAMIERFRLVFDQYGNPRYEGVHGLYGIRILAPKEE